MKNIFLAVTLCVIASEGALADSHQDQVVQARGVVKQFFGALKGELEMAMKAGGPVAAIGVCNAQAPIIASESSAQSGWNVARTSLKLRNLGNKPDEWELKVLEDFEVRKAAGEDVAQMEYSQVVTFEGQQAFRYMKAIPTAELCLSCHGSDIKPEVAKSLDTLYPEDQARGFNAGDIRGAFTLRNQM